MSKRIYPYLYQAYKQRETMKACCKLCDKRATHRAEFQYSWFRGDDEQILVCEQHLEVARSNPKHLHAMLAAAEEERRNV